MSWAHPTVRERAPELLPPARSGGFAFGGTDTVSRSGYTDDLDQWDLIRYRGRVASATRGKRGQSFFRALLAALDAMPEKRLVAHDLRDATGAVCAIGSLGVARGVALEAIDPYDHETLGETFDIAECLVGEVEYMNDEYPLNNETPEQRWVRMRAWVAAQVKP